MCNKALKSAYKSEVGHEGSPHAKEAFKKAASEAAGYFEKYGSSVRSGLPISLLNKGNLQKSETVLIRLPKRMGI